jgi:hypothetical protein
LAEICFIPAVSLGFIVFAIFSTVYPIPAFPFNLTAYMVTGWVIVGALLIAIVGSRKMGIEKLSI